MIELTILLVKSAVIFLYCMLCASIVQLWTRNALRNPCFMPHSWKNERWIFQRGQRKSGNFETKFFHQNWQPWSVICQIRKTSAVVPSRHQWWGVNDRSSISPPYETVVDNRLSKSSLWTCCLSIFFRRFIRQIIRYNIAKNVTPRPVTIMLPTPLDPWPWNPALFSRCDCGAVLFLMWCRFDKFPISTCNLSFVHLACVVDTLCSVLGGKTPYEHLNVAKFDL